MIVNDFIFMGEEAPKIEIDNITVTYSTRTYNGSSQSAGISCQYENETLIQNINYTVTGTASATNAGTYSFTITGIGRFVGSKSYNWTINKKPVTFSSVSVSPTTVNSTSYTTITCTGTLSSTQPTNVYPGFSLSGYMNAKNWKATSGTRTISVKIDIQAQRTSGTVKVSFNVGNLDNKNYVLSGTPPTKTLTITG